MIVSITGGRGFIGKYLTEKHLYKDDTVRLLTRNLSFTQDCVEYFEGDLSDPGVELADFVEGSDLLYHCAGEINDESMMRPLHVDGTQRLVEASLKGGVGRWVQLSSVGAYGVCRSGVVTEMSPENPSSVYEKTKTEADDIVKSSGIPYVILRPSNVFGLTMRNQSLFRLVEMLRRGWFFYIGEAGVLFNYVHVADVVEALVLCGSDDRAYDKTYNLSQTIEIEQMVESISLGLVVERKIFRLPDYPIRLLGNAFGWLPGFPLTVSRIDALTGRHRYQSSKIIEELCFEFDSSLHERFFQFASHLK
jgi:nucleoside-diphosphate-sugar epimerase